MKKTIIFIFAFLCLISYAYADDNMSISQGTGATSSSTGSANNASNGNDGNMLTQFNNAAYPSSWSVVFDCSNLNCYVANLTVHAGTYSTAVDVAYQNASTGAWVTGWKTIPATGGGVRTVFYFNNTELGASGFNFSSAGDIGIFEVIAVNGTNSSPTSGNPPNILSYNMTSDGGLGCTNWNTNKSNACFTNDTTPTVKFIIDVGAYCRIGVSDLNYTTLGASRDCSGGQGTTSHTCTLTSQDESVYDLTSLNIGCRDTQGNENKTSTSGNLTIGGFETPFRNAIELGIRNSLVNAYTTYTDIKVYARNSANSQSVGRFDKIAKKSSKIWAINRVGASDSHVNMFNVMPVLYTLEVYNKTTSQIRNETELFINGTR